MKLTSSYTNILSKSFYFFFHPLLLAFYVWIVMLIFLPSYFAKYNAKIIETKPVEQTSKLYFRDMDGDGISEELHSNYTTNELYPNITYFTIDNFLINQWNLRGKWLTYQKIFFGDYNHNGFDEAYCFSRVKDSIFLNINEILLDDGLEITERYVCEAGIFNIDQADIHDGFCHMQDIDGDQTDELVFSLFSGYSKQPRNTFVYYIKKDSIVSSPLSAAGVTKRMQYMDLNSDGIDELTGITGANENNHSNMPYTDSSSWLMVYNPKDGMDFLFPPIEFDGGIGSTVYPTFYEINNEKIIAAVFISHSASKGFNGFWLKLFNQSGGIINERLIPFKDHNFLLFINPPDKQDNALMLMDNYANVYKTDTSLNISLFSKATNIGQIDLRHSYWIDIDNDGDKEFLTVAKKSGFSKLLIYRSNLTEYSITDLPKTVNATFVHYSLKFSDKNQAPVLVMQDADTVYYIEYNKSKVYFLKYPVYASCYLILFMFFWLLQRIQTRVAKRKFEAERHLIRQQLTISKNQLEPHFLLNVLNNIGSMFLHDNRQDAQYYFGKFTSLIHHNLEYADRIETSLDEELKFIEDYLALQKQRLNGDLDYSIESDFEINLNQIKIPHSLIFTFVENAIKHGLFPKPNDRNLEIRIKKTEQKIHIIISDDGIGRDNAKALKTAGTGKGTMIAQNIISSYNKLNKRSISYSINDLFDDDGKGIGTSIKLII